MRQCFRLIILVLLFSVNRGDQQMVCFKYEGPCPNYPEWSGSLDDSPYAYRLPWAFDVHEPVLDAAVADVCSVAFVVCSVVSGTISLKLRARVAVTLAWQRTTRSA